MPPLKLEIAANSLASARAAQEGGADRVELCASLGVGGLTPSHATIAMARDQLHIPLYVLIRPREGDFCYELTEFEIMRQDIAVCARLGCDGVVIGALTAEGGVDTNGCASLIAAAGSMGVTFHRAFDVAPDQRQALEDIIALGCERVLTSGGCADAVLGAEAIAARVAQAAGRIQIMAGAGLRADNIADVVHRTGAAEFHASAKRRRQSTMQWRKALPGLADEHEQSDVGQVRGLADVLQGLSQKLEAAS